MTHDLGLDRRTFIAAAAGATILPTMAVSSTIQQVRAPDGSGQEKEDVGADESHGRVGGVRDGTPHQVPCRHAI